MAKNRRARGRSHVAAGKTKQRLGKLIGNEQMEATGTTQVHQGEADEAAAKASERAVGAGLELSGTIKPAIGDLGDLIDSPELSIEGQAEANQGTYRQNGHQ